MAAAVAFRYKAADPCLYQPFWRFNENTSPCTCCSAIEAIEYGWWTCARTSASWFIVDEIIESWADMVDADIAEMRSRESAADKAARLAKQLAQERDLELTCEAAKMANYGDMQKYRNTVGRGRDAHIHKTTGPCKWLYCDEKAPKSQWTRNSAGEMCAPLKPALTGSQCWAWEYTDPRTHRKVVKHTCKYLHPGEAGWLQEWNKDRTYRAPPPPPTGAAAWMAARVPTAPAAAPKPAPKVTNSFAALDDNSSW